MGVRTMKTTKKTLTSMMVLALTLGIAGCATASQAVTTSNNSVKTASVASSSNSSSTKQTSTSQASSASQSSAATSASSEGTAPATSSSAASSTSSSSVANSNVSSDVYNSFVKDSGMSLNKDQSLIATQKSDGTYQVDVRSTDGDPNIAHLNGTYTYNQSTGSVTENSNE